MSTPFNSTYVDGQLIPKRIQFETFYGCNARCTMCAISKPPTRPVGVMPMALFESVVDSLAPYAAHIEKVDLFALGEPLLDPFLFERIRLLKARGFHGLAISTNAHLLHAEKQRQLLDTGIETVIFSIDGVKKETHEAIRRRTNFETVVRNAVSTIRLRDTGRYPTRFVVRFIRQPSNLQEWPAFQEFWGSQLSARKNDLLIVYDVNSMGGEMFTKPELVHAADLDPAIERMPCHQIFDRLIILADGSVPLCCEDTPRATYNFGNVGNTPPLEIWNSKPLARIRDLHLKEKKANLKLCGECTMLYSESKTQVIRLEDLELPQPC